MRRARRPYPAGWESEAVLSDGGTVQIRPFRPDDVPALEAFHSRLSDETIYLRYFSTHRTLSKDELQFFASVDYERRMALVVVLGRAIVGVALYYRFGRGGEAEVALVVEDAQQGRGLGSLLLEHLAGYARAKGIVRFVADVLPQNFRMQRVFSDLGFRVTAVRGLAEVHITMPLELTPSTVAAVDRREHVAEARSVARLLAPGSVAVVGHGPNVDATSRLLRNLRSFPGPVSLVHFGVKRLEGIVASPTMRDLPQVDVVVVTGYPQRLSDLVTDCARQGARGLIVLSAGPDDGDPRELTALVRSSGIRMIGPGSLGVINTAAGLHATALPVAVAEGRTAFLTQSAAVGAAGLRRAAELGIGISSFVSVGERWDVSTNDLLQFWEDDQRTAAVLLYLESFGNPRKFSRITRRLTRAKPVVVVRPGRSGLLLRTTTGKVSDEVVDALFSQTGVVRVGTVEELFDVAEVLGLPTLPGGDGVVVLSGSAGASLLAADACAAAGLVLPALQPATRDRLSAMLPAGAATANPVDLLRAAPTSQILDAVAADPGVHAVIAIVDPPVAPPPAPADTPLLWVTLGSDPLAVSGPPAPAACFAFPERAALALGRAAAAARWRRRPAPGTPPMERVDPAGVRRLVEHALADQPGGAILPHAAAIELLDRSGIDALTTVPVASAQQALAAADAVGYPVALKAARVSTEHREDIGAVRLNLGTAHEVQEAYATVAQHATDHVALVQPMAPRGVELIVTVTPDPAFGPVLRVRFGGPTGEVVARPVTLIPPVTADQIEDALQAMPGARLLTGYRRSPPADVAALTNLLLRVAWLADTLPELAELTLDPVVAGPDGATVIDVRARVASHEPHPELSVRRLRQPPTEASRASGE